MSASSDSASSESDAGVGDAGGADFAAWDNARRREAADFFPSGARVFVARAPGRLDVLGGIADYSGSLVAEMPIADAAVCGAMVGGTDDGSVVVRSLDADASVARDAILPAELFVNPVSLLRFLRDAPPALRWTGYVAGCVSLLRADGLIGRGVGARLLLRSSVPLGAGVSSSAAVEVASMRALCAAFGIVMDGLTLAKLCQRVENEIVDAPCGIMDQVTSALGQADRLLLLRCQPATIEGTVLLPPDWSVFGIDSGVKHSVGGDAYGRVRVAAFMGAKILADTAKSGFGGYLCNVTPARYAQILPDGLPETMRGDTFLAAHGGILDTVTRVDPSAVYPVRAAAEHAIFENARVEAFVEDLRRADDSAFSSAGMRMSASHESYTRCGLGSPETDRLVALSALHPDVAGAKITGGGSGGTVCVLCKTVAAPTIVSTMAHSYQEQTGIFPRVISGSSPGAFATNISEVIA